jgi:hypothetical protein
MRPFNLDFDIDRGSTGESAKKRGRRVGGRGGYPKDDVVEEGDVIRRVLLESKLVEQPIFVLPDGVLVSNPFDLDIPQEKPAHHPIEVHWTLDPVERVVIKVIVGGDHDVSPGHRVQLVVPQPPEPRGVVLPWVDQDFNPIRRSDLHVQYGKDSIDGECE